MPKRTLLFDRFLFQKNVHIRGISSTESKQRFILYCYISIMFICERFLTVSCTDLRLLKSTMYNIIKNTNQKYLLTACFQMVALVIFPQTFFCKWEPYTTQLATPPESIHQRLVFAWLYLSVCARKYKLETACDK